MNDSLRTRREFLRDGAKYAALAAAAPFLPAFLTRTVWAGAEEGARAWTRGTSGRMLVVVQLAGGNDGLNTVVPYTDDGYLSSRSSLCLTEGDVLKLNDRLGFHPSLRPFKELHDAGKLAIVQGVGYPNPDRSHFRSMEIWHAGAGRHEDVKTGWLGRYFDAQCTGKEPGPATIGVNLGKVFPGAFANTRNLGTTLEDPETYVWQPSGTTKALVKAQEKVFEELNTPRMAEDMALDFLQHTGMNAALSAERVRGAVAGYKSKTAYPASQLATSLRLIAAMMAGGLETRVFYAHQGGYDTHNNQRGTHDRLLSDLSTCLAAFQSDLESLGLADRVTTVVFSEFGRRVKENASGGTDHGAASQMFVVGSKVKPGLHGTYPSLTDLADGDLKHTVDFRSVYASVLADWLGANPAEILGPDVTPLRVIA